MVAFESPLSPEGAGGLCSFIGQGALLRMIRAFRQLSAVYLVTAGLYSCLIILHERPGLTQDLLAGSSEAKRQGIEIAENVSSWASAQTHALAMRVTEWLEQRNTKPAPLAVASSKPAPAPVTASPKVAVIQEKPVAAVPIAPKTIVPRDFAREFPPLRPQLAEPAPSFAEAPPRPETSQPKSMPEQSEQAELRPPEEALPNAGEIARVEQRLRVNLTSELLTGFDLFLYVSKAERGPWAQRMYVFDKQSGGDLALMHAWPVSTGRDARVLTKNGLRVALNTPTGYYQLDPGRFYTRYTSMEWGMPMPNAMFFNWVHDGDQTGLAIHGASGEDVALLGTRASAGCIRLAPDNAKELFNLIRTKYKGPVPRFAYDTKTSTMSNDGILWHDRNGNLRLADGYKVLVFIEDFSGENVVAMLY